MGGVGDWIGDNAGKALGMFAAGPMGLNAVLGDGKGKGQSAKPPDFSAAAHANTMNPLGSQTWNGNTSTFGFNDQAGQQFQSLLSGMNQNTAQDKAYAALQSRLDPAWQNRSAAFDAQLANQGLQPGTEAYNNAARAFGQQRNDAYAQAAGQAIGIGQQEQAQARQSAQAMMGMLGQQGNNLYSGLPAAQAQYSAAQDAKAAENAKKGSAMGGLGSIGGAIFGGAFGGPPGAMAGSSIGGSLGGRSGSKGKGGSKATPYNAANDW